MGNVPDVDLPLTSGPVAAWLAALACGASDLRETVNGCRRASGTETLVGPDGHRTRWDAIAELAAGGTVHLLLPDHGDPAGLGQLWDGRPGERVLLLNTALEDTVTILQPDPTWCCREVAHTYPGHLVALRGEASSDAARLLAGAIREATGALAALGLDRPDREVRAQLANLEVRLHMQYLPRALRQPERIDSATRMLLIARRALAGPGAAVTSSEAEARAQPLRELARAARRALGAAYVDVGTVRA